MSITRRMLSGTTQLTISNGVMRLLSIVTMPILTRLLSPTAYGVATLVGSIISLVSVFALAGIDMSYARSYHSALPPHGATVEHFCWRFAIISALIVATLTALVWWFFSLYSNELESWLAIVLALGILLSVVQAMTQVRARLSGSYRAMSIALVASGVGSAAVSIGIAAFWRQDAIALLFSMLVGYAIPIMLLGIPSIKGLLIPSDLTMDEGTTMIKIGLAGIVTAPMYWLLSSSDRWFLQYFHGAETVGVYSIGYSVAIVGMMVNSAVMSVWLPEASREYEQDPIRAQETLGKLMSRLIAAMALIWLMVTAAGGDIVRLLASQRFYAAADYVPFIAGGVFFYGVQTLCCTGLLLTKKLNLAAWWWFAGGLVCVAINLVLVPKYGGVGAAITQSISFALISIGILITSQAKFRLKLEWVRLSIVMLIILVAAVLMASQWNNDVRTSLLTKFPVGLGLSVLVASIVAPDWFTRGIFLLKHRYFNQ